MSAKEFGEWMAFYQLEPFGAKRLDFGPAMVASVIAETNRNPKRRRKPFTYVDFLPEFDQQAKVQSPEEMQRQLDQALGGDE